MSEVEIPSHLRRVDTENFEISRQKHGKGYQYFRGEEKISEENQLNLLREIPVPDTWTEVTLASRPNSHILARGYDGSGKLQYLYHPDYTDFRNLAKFDDLIEFGKSLPRLRRRLRQDLKSPQWNRQKLLALMVKILDKYHLRIGSKKNAKARKSYGLTTLRKKHFHEEEDHVYFEYQGKSGQTRHVDLTDSYLIEMMDEIAEFPGWELFSFSNGGEKISASSGAVNDYIRQISGGDFSARDFRTWAGTVLSVKYLAEAKKEVAKNPRRKLGSILVDLVSDRLGNTSAICRDYYIHPTVLEKVIAEDFDPKPCDPKFLKNNLYRKHECRALEILSKK